MINRHSNGIILSKTAFFKRLVTIVVLLYICFISLLVISLRKSKTQYVKRAAITTQNLTLTLEKQLVGIIEKINLAMLSISDEIQHQSANGVINAQETNVFVSRLHTRLPELDSLRATNALGDIIYGVGIDRGNITNIADRNYFTNQRDPDAGLVISKPVMGRINGKWNLVFSRRLSHHNGSFAGIVFATITLEKLSKSFSQLDVGSHGSVVLLNKDFGLIARHPEYEGIDKNIGKKNVSPKLLELVNSGQTSGTYSAQIGAVNVERMISFRKVGDYPFYIVVSFAKDDYLAEWWEDVIHETTLTLIFILLTLLASWLFYNNWKQRTAAQDQINQLVYYDALTHLPNRRLLTDRLEQALVQAKRFKRSLAVMFLDLDHFKQVNDTLGHDAGDELLKVVAERLLASVRSVDTVCRQGGDEFIIVLPEITHLQDAELVADKIIKAISEPICIQENNLHVTTSVGIAVFPVNGIDDSTMLMKKADMAMYEAKNNGRNGFYTYQSEEML